MNNGWMGTPIDLVRQSDGTLVSIDNTRLFAASRVNIPVNAIVHSVDEPLSAEIAERFMTKEGGVPTTWDEAALNRINKKISRSEKKMMKKNLSFREVVTIISEEKEDKPFKGLNGIVIGIAKEDDDDYIHSYRVRVFDREERYIESTSFYPEGLVSLGKVAHGEFNKSHFSLKVSNDGDITEVIEPSESFFISMESLSIFNYVDIDEDFKKVPVKLKNEVLENNKSYEIINKSTFKKWEDGKKISSEKQAEIMKNFKEEVFKKFGVEIEYE